MATFIRMTRDYKVSYRSGWLYKGETYDAKDIEGGDKTVEKLLKSGWAKIENNTKKVSKISISDHRLRGNIDADSAPSLQDVRKMVQSGDLLNLAKTAVNIVQHPQETVVQMAVETAKDAIEEVVENATGNDLFD